MKPRSKRVLWATVFKGFIEIRCTVLDVLRVNGTHDRHADTFLPLEVSCAGRICTHVEINMHLHLANASKLSRSRVALPRARCWLIVCKDRRVNERPSRWHRNSFPVQMLARVHRSFDCNRDPFSFRIPRLLRTLARILNNRWGNPRPFTATFVLSTPRQQACVHCNKESPSLSLSRSSSLSLSSRLGQFIRKTTIKPLIVPFTRIIERKKT